MPACWQSCKELTPVAHTRQGMGRTAWQGGHVMLPGIADTLFARLCLQILCAFWQALLNL